MAYQTHMLKHTQVSPACPYESLVDVLAELSPVPWSFKQKCGYFSFYHIKTHMQILTDAKSNPNKKETKLFPPRSCIKLITSEQLELFKLPKESPFF